jgi:signal transduction histidine kinase
LVYVAVVVNQFSKVKYDDQKRVIITNKASPHDLTAEFLLRNVSERIIADTTLVDVMTSKGQNEVLEYIRRNYFSGSYWNTYESYQCVVCSDSTSLELANGQRVPNCVAFFKQMIEESGTQLSQSQFYYINRKQTDLLGSYLGWFRMEAERNAPLYLFIEFWTRGASDDIGYPELLLDSQTSQGNNLNGYSFAKYHKNRRISQSGTFNYSLSGDMFQPAPGQPDDYHTVISDEMEHLVYCPDPSNMIVLSSHHPNFMSLAVNFSYSFILAFLLVSIIVLFFLPVRTTFQWNLRNKIQISMIVTIIVSFAVIGAYTFIHINSQYENKHNSIISEKMQSVYKELQNALQLQNNTDAQWKNDTDELTEWLLLFRGMFSTDINLYDVNGRLLATSVPDVFERGLVSWQINPEAYIKLRYGQNASIIEHENIGSLEYISAYEPVVDNNNNVVAILNLPYFTQRDELSAEISNLVVAIINFYMIIIFITVIISVVIGNQITYPLNLLQEKFKNIKLGEKNEPIRYIKNDEIGHLVKEYNRAIDELAKNATRLARSERESAWQDMAKQIAHEINNPLTPMKLSIQHLKRAWDNQSERFAEYMEKISHSLIEQIDTLSAIATEFSNFAKMPTVHNQPIDIITSINDVVPLFATGENKRAFPTYFHDLDKAMVFADKEQMSRVFINLFKNALQAMPKNRKPHIQTDVMKLRNLIYIHLKDNGSGIPEEMQENIFQPNFTTKSSGMGVGLNMVRNIIENIGGTITFNTKQGEGTTFFICLPALEEDTENDDTKNTN